MTRAKRVGLTALQWVVCAGMIYVVWTFVLQPGFSTAFFVGIGPTWSKLVDFFHDGTLGSMLAVTLKEALIGFAIGTGIGVVLALLIGLTPALVGRVFEPFIAGFYAMPKFVLAPILFIWIGSGFLPRMYLVMLAVFPVVTIYLISGIRTVDPNTVLAMRRYGASRLQIGTKLLLPHTMGYFITAMSFVLPHALTFAIGAEILFGSSDGIGGVLFSQSQFFNSAGVLAALVVGTALSAVFIWLARQVGARLLGVDARRAI
jgi:sulfonate transport system permease protein